jgi:dCTP deaminase
MVPGLGDSEGIDYLDTTILPYEGLVERLDIDESYADDKILITPLLDPSFGTADGQLTSAGIDLRLDFRFRRILPGEVTAISLVRKQRIDTAVELDVDDPRSRYVLHPGDFVLGQSMEYIRLPNDIVGRLDGRSSMGRRGLEVHSTASCVDPGFQGHLVFELSNVGRAPIILHPFIRIARLVFYKTRPTAFPYQGKYRFQNNVMPIQLDKLTPLLKRQRDAETAD